MWTKILSPFIPYKKIIGIAAIAMVVYSSYAYVNTKYDTWHNEPIRLCNAKIVSTETNATREMQIKDEVLQQAGKTINELSQQLYDLNQSIPSLQVNSDKELIECQEKNEELEWRLKNAKINTTDEFFWTKLPI